MGGVVPGSKDRMCGAEGKTAKPASTNRVKTHTARHCASGTFLSFLRPFPENPPSSSTTLRAPGSPERDKELLSDQLSCNERVTPGFLIYGSSLELAFARAARVTHSQSAMHFTIIPQCLSGLLFLPNFPFSFLFKSLVSLLFFSLSLL